MTTLATGDMAPDFTLKLNAVLTGASAVVLIKRPDQTVVTRTATLTDAAAGELSITWQAGDLAQAGTYYAQVKVTYSNGKPQTFVIDDKGQSLTFQVVAVYA